MCGYDEFMLCPLYAHRRVMPEAWNGLSEAQHRCSRDACFTLPQLARVGATESV